jgi:deazaflavin-dependent oxidoreductase (nitroreductase family)
VKHSALNVWLVKAGVGLHIGAYRLLRGNLPQPWLGEHCILLNTRGRRSGKPRTNPLVFVRDGDDYAVVASWGGSDTHPHWFMNLQGDPRATVEDHGRTYSVVASVVEDEADYARLWERFVRVYPGYELYKRRTARRIPIVRLATTGER